MTDWVLPQAGRQIEREAASDLAEAHRGLGSTIRRSARRCSSLRRLPKPSRSRTTISKACSARVLVRFTDASLCCGGTLGAPRRSGLTVGWSKTGFKGGGVKREQPVEQRLAIPQVTTHTWLRRGVRREQNTVQNGQTIVRMDRAGLPRPQCPPEYGATRLTVCR